MTECSFFGLNSPFKLIWLAKSVKESDWCVCLYRVILMTYLGPPHSRALTVCRDRHGDRLDSKRVILHCALDRLRQLEEKHKRTSGERERTDDQRKTDVCSHTSRQGEWETRPDVFSVHPADERRGAIQTGRLLPREELGEQHRVQLDKEREFSSSCLKREFTKEWKSPHDLLPLKPS